VGACSRWEGDIGCGSDHGRRLLLLLLLLLLLPPPPRSCSTDSGRGKHPLGLASKRLPGSRRPGSMPKGKRCCGSVRCSRWGSISRPTSSATERSCDVDREIDPPIIVWRPSGALEGRRRRTGIARYRCPIEWFVVGAAGGLYCRSAPPIGAIRTRLHRLAFWRTKSPRSRTCGKEDVAVPAQDPSPSADVGSLLSVGVSTAGVFCHPGRTALTVRPGKHRAALPESEEEKEAALMLGMSKDAAGAVHGRSGRANCVGCSCCSSCPAVLRPGCTITTTSRPSDPQDRILSQPPEGTCQLLNRLGARAGTSSRRANPIVGCRRDIIQKV
jgi:hypothetical protein